MQRLPVVAMAAGSDRRDLKLSRDAKQLLIQAAAIEGLSLAAFVRSAARKRAREAILREREVRLSQRDCEAFQAAIHKPFGPSPALEQAPQRARSEVRHA